MNKTTTKSKKGFACMKPELQREICTKGGKTIAKRGKAWMSRIGRKGGLSTGKLLRQAVKAKQEAA